MRSDKEHAAVVAGQLANHFLTRGLRETTTGDFLASHKEVLLYAFGAVELIPQPRLKWQNSESAEPDIIPDFILVKPDGGGEICDLKLPLLDKANITKGSRARRDFRAEVSEGLAQLAHYHEYAADAANQEFVRGRYGVRLSSGGQLTMIVGTGENARQSEVVEALRPYERRYRVLNYDDVLQLYCAAAMTDHQEQR